MACMAGGARVPLSGRFFERWLLGVKRRETPAARLAHDAFRWLLKQNVPDTSLTHGAYCVLGTAYDTWTDVREMMLAKLLWEPMLRARCQQVGAGLRLMRAPYIRGHTRIFIGEGCAFSSLDVSSGRFHDKPELRFGDDCQVGYDNLFAVNERISIGSHVGISQRVVVRDSDGHPSDPARRMRGESLSKGDIAPVTVLDYAWIGRDAHVLKGVTVGAGAIVASGSVVVSDIPDGAIAMGVPARVIRRAT
jgi:acetyltransferase-like isoleucine patch superfamily enzyme